MRRLLRKKGRIIVMDLISYQDYYQQAQEEEHVKVPGKISCSSLPALSGCRLFVSSDSSSDAALKGTTLHIVLKYWLERLINRTKHLDNDWPLEESEKLDSMVSTVRTFIHDGWTIDAQEVFYSDHEICGTIDLVLGRGPDSIVADFKTGFVWVSSKSPQLQGYAKLLGPGKVYTMIIQPNQESKYFLAETGIVEHILNKPMIATINENCQYCEKLNGCSEVNKRIEEAKTLEPDTKESQIKLIKIGPLIAKKVKLAKEEIKKDLGEDFYLTETTKKSISLSSLIANGVAVPPELIKETTFQTLRERK